MSGGPGNDPRSLRPTLRRVNRGLPDGCADATLQARPAGCGHRRRVADDSSGSRTTIRAPRGPGVAWQTTAAGRGPRSGLLEVLASRGRRQQPDTKKRRRFRGAASLKELAYLTKRQWPFLFLPALAAARSA